MERLSDTILVEKVVAGDQRAFGELVSRHQSVLRRFFLSQTLGNGDLSDDLAQETFIKAYTHIASFRGTASFQTWLMRIAYNVFYDYKRKEKIQDGHIVQEPNAPLPTREGLGVGLKLDLYTALAQLKDEERLCITLQLIDGYDIAGIAEMTHMKEGTVKSHLSRGKEKMVDYLKHHGYDRR